MKGEKLSDSGQEKISAEKLLMLSETNIIYKDKILCKTSSCEFPM